jgi:hypothetical protein
LDVSNVATGSPAKYQHHTIVIRVAHSVLPIGLKNGYKLNKYIIVNPYITIPAIANINFSVLITSPKTYIIVAPIYITQKNAPVYYENIPPFL